MTTIGFETAIIFRCNMVGFLDFEYELLNAGVFDGNRYFDVVIEYAKADPYDILAKMIQQSGGWREEMD